MSSVCTFTYTSFVLAAIYLILFGLVLKYLRNIIQGGAAKKRAQKIFLAILLAHTIRQQRARRGRLQWQRRAGQVSRACSPSMRGTPGASDPTRSAEWWMHLLGNLPAMLFLMAFSVLVYTFARIYHKVLLAGVWFQERRFNALTGALVLLNVLALIATFGDWAHAASSAPSDNGEGGDDDTLAFFVNFLVYSVTGVSAILAIMFVVYGALLYFQVQAIIRASSENVSSTTGQQHQLSSSHNMHLGHQMGGDSRVGGGSSRNLSHHPSFSQGPPLVGTRERPFMLPSHSSSGFGMTMPGNSMAAPLMMPSFVGGEGVGTGFTPVNHLAGGRAAYRWEQSQAKGDRADRDMDAEPESPPGQDASYEPEGQYLPPNISGHSSGTASRHGLTGVSSTPVMGAVNIRSSNSGLPPAGSHVEVVPAHSYVSHSTSASFNTVAGPAGGASEVDKLLRPGGATVSGYASSVSPEYSRLPNSTQRVSQAHRAIITSPNGSTALTTAIVSGGSPATPTDQLVGSMPYGSAPGAAAVSGRKATSSLAKQSPSTQRSQGGMYPSHQEEDEDAAAIEAGRGGGVCGVGGWGGAVAYQHGSTPAPGSEGVYPNVYQSANQQQLLVSPSRPGAEFVRDRGSVMMSPGEDSTSLSSLAAHTPLLSAPAPPPNPMMKIALIASICAACLVARFILIIVMIEMDVDFGAVTSMVYFLMTEVLPLVIMLQVLSYSSASLIAAGGAGAAAATAAADTHQTYQQQGRFGMTDVDRSYTTRR